MSGTCLQYSLSLTNLPTNRSALVRCCSKCYQCAEQLSQPIELAWLALLLQLELGRCHVQEAKHLVALSPNLISVQPRVGRENKKREKAEFIIFREIKVPGNIPVIHYLPISHLAHTHGLVIPYTNVCLKVVVLVK